MPGSPKEKNRKIKRGQKKAEQEGGGLTRMWGTTTVPGCPPLCSPDEKQQPASRVQGPSMYGARFLLPILTPTRQAPVCQLPQVHMHSALPHSWGRGVDSSYDARSWNWMKLTAIYCPSLPLEFTSLLGLQSSTIQQAVSNSATAVSLGRGIPGASPTHDPRILVYRVLCEHFCLFVSLG